ncbi:MAG TPA: glycosyl hydrolase family 18 protein, partial [Bryobacteraceae bacterium]|nr:glycosyl hydrolase family 18 protein [Bryobacteraceae bacterium]
MQSAAVVFAIALALFLLVLFNGTQLPALGLPAVAPIAQLSDVPAIIRGQKAQKNVPYRIPKPAKIRYLRSPSPVLHPRPAAKALKGAPLVWAFYVNWDPGSIVSLRLHLSHITHLVPEWLTLANAKGDINDDTDQTAVEIAHQANLPIFALLTNYRDGWKPGDVRRVLKSAELRSDLIGNIRSNLAEHKFAGINIDFESLQPRDREPLVRFMRELSAEMHRDGYIVSEDVPVDDNAYDLKRLAEVCDYLVPMIYDEHYQSGEPGPVASEKFFEDELDKVSKLAPPEKLIAGFGNYGYDWQIGGTGSEEVTFDDVMAAATESHTAIEWEQNSENPALRYTL